MKHCIDNSRIRVIRTGRPHNAINVSCERLIRRSCITTQLPFTKNVIVEEIFTYEMACDAPRTYDNYFGSGSVYAETEASGAYWTFDNVISAEIFINTEF